MSEAQNPPTLPGDAIWTDSERLVLFEIRCALRDLSVIGKMCTESIDKLHKSMEALARRKKVKLTAKEYHIENVQSITLSFS
jgi:hypothetical protein